MTLKGLNTIPNSNSNESSDLAIRKYSGLNGNQIEPSNALSKFTSNPTTSANNNEIVYSGYGPVSARNYGLPTDIDLEGGTLLSVDETEEIDPEDNCRVQITCYHILSADGAEESTITKRRKLKVNCTQSLKRVEYSNGKESKVEEKTTIFDNVDALNGYPVNVHPALHLHHSIDSSNCSIQDNKDIDNVLLQTQSTFLSLLNEKKDKLVLMFPDLFSNLRTQPAIFQHMPSTVMETVVNPDGSTTTHTKSSKAFSSRYTCQETYLNGVRQERTTKFRAFMEYAGPEGGFCIRLNDDADAELSESEDIDFVAGKVARSIAGSAPQAAIDDSKEDSQSRISRSGLSEIPDTASALVAHAGDDSRSGVPKLVNAEPMRKREKAWHAVNELVESEGRYVQKLALLEKFREEVEKERLLDRRQMTLLFANIESLYRFHNDHLLPQLMDRHREWQSTQKISDVMRKQAPFLKMYSEYTNNYKQSTQTFEECLRKKKHFDEIVRRVEHLPESENLSLVSHLICPVQRVMRYQLLLKEYQKYLNPTDLDYADTEVALTLVLEAASHANEMMRKLDRYRNVLEVQEQLGNSISLVSPSRELLIKAKLLKISSTTNKAEERFVFVFSDLFLLASERTSIGLISGSKYKLRAIFDACYTQICEGDNFEREYSFYLRGSDSPNGPLRCVELCCNSQSEKNSLFETLWSVIDEVQTRRNSAHEDNLKTCNHNGKESYLSPSMTLPILSRTNNGERKSCARCDIDFAWYSRGYVCSKCFKRFCKKCFGRLRFEAKPNRLCTDCLRLSVPLSHSEGMFTNSDHPPQKRRNLLATPAYDDADIIKASYIAFKSGSSTTISSSAGSHNANGNNGIRKYFVLRKNFCLYSYKSNKEKCASVMMPMTGCDVAPSTSDKLSFVIRHMNRVYNIQCVNESDHAEWLAALILSANAQLPIEAEENDDDYTIKLNDQMPVKRSASVGDRFTNSILGQNGYLKPPGAQTQRYSTTSASRKYT